MRIKVYGHNDDLIEVEDSLNEEFSWCNPEDEERSLAFSDGTLLSVTWGRHGIWRFGVLAKGTAEIDKHECIPTEDESDGYSDVVTLTGDIKWVAFAERVLWK